ncbi:unnamed protein product [Paramecium pentaurelia]|uniref:40S ribosomal protein S30 n=1 Tax=Paramecium pentaurelia TaxID=43138 RepID=A0A8S1S8U7_9CILI|nr:unnamed protein product [Paramecium pentaurelia]
MGKLHGTLAKAGKVRKQTPKIEKQVRRHKIPKGRAYKRICFNRRFGGQTATTGPQQRKKGPNWHAGRKDLIEEERKKQVEQRRQRKKDVPK